MQIEGSDPLVTFAPDIDCQLLTYCDVVSENGKYFLHIRGALLNKGFPSYEAFIKDKFGNAVFIHTFGPAGESKLDYELLCNTYDYIRRFEMKIQVDNSGRFLNENLIVGVDQNSYDNIFDLGAILDEPLSHPDLNSPNFSFSTTTITSWNNENLSKSAAGDCSSQPCQGQYPGN